MHMFCWLKKRIKEDDILRYIIKYFFEMIKDRILACLFVFVDL